MAGETPVDGFTVERIGTRVILTLSNRYGEIEEYEFPIEDAVRVARAILVVSGR